MSGRLTGKVALVTGGASGIGLAIAQTFINEGARVVIADISDDCSARAAELGEAAVAVKADVSVAADAERMVDITVDRFGRIDILCNNAGIDGELALTGEFDIDNFDRVIAINLRGVFLGHRYGIPALLGGGGGSIINIASVAALNAVPRAAAYCAAKAGVLGLTRVAAAEYAANGIRVNAICPGIIETPLMRSLKGDPTLEAIIAATPARRLGRAEEIAALALYLASDESTFQTGTATPVDGGYVTL